MRSEAVPAPWAPAMRKARRLELRLLRIDPRLADELGAVLEAFVDGFWRAWEDSARRSAKSVTAAATRELLGDASKPRRQRSPAPPAREQRADGARPRARRKTR